MSSVSRPADVVVLGEVLVELSSLGPLTGGASIRLGFSGDALNVAAAATAAGARTVLLTRVPDDELGDALVARIGELGIETGGVLRTRGQHGVYFTHADPDGERQFVYVRGASAGSALCVDDLDERLLASAAVVVASGVTAAISPTAAAAVRRAAELAQRFVYDPNYRPRLTSAAEAGALLRAVAPQAAVITPSWPGETSALLGLPPGTPAEEALEAARALGAAGTVLTCGREGALVASEGAVHRVPALTAPRVVDQTGAGDCLTGTLAGRLALGDSLRDAVQLAVAAAALSVQGQGGTGHVPTLEETRRMIRDQQSDEVGTR